MPEVAGSDNVAAFEAKFQHWLRHVVGAGWLRRWRWELRGVVD
jgi:hypothetical protein